MTPGMQMLADMADHATATTLFAMIILAAEVALLFAMLFGGLLLRAAWRWLFVHNWNNVIVSAEHKAPDHRGH